MTLPAAPSLGLAMRRRSSFWRIVNWFQRGGWQDPDIDRKCTCEGPPKSRQDRPGCGHNWRLGGRRTKWWEKIEHDLFFPGNREILQENRPARLRATANHRERKQRFSLILQKQITQRNRSDRVSCFALMTLKAGQLVRESIFHALRVGCRQPILDGQFIVGPGRRRIGEAMVCNSVGIFSHSVSDPLASHMELKRAEPSLVARLTVIFAFVCDRVPLNRPLPFLLAEDSRCVGFAGPGWSRSGASRSSSPAIPTNVNKA